MKDELPDLGILRRCWDNYADVSTTHRVAVHGVDVGGLDPVVIAGPCAIESYEQALGVARAVRSVGIRLMRGGVFKPRTNPHSFQGLGHEGLRILSAIRKETGVGIVTEVMDPRLVERVAECADMIQIGSRSMQNFPLLTEVGKSRKPILLKRGWSSTLEEWLCAAEYVAKEGNRDIVLCERGVRTSSHWSYARNVLDLNVIEPLRRVTPLPVIVDPSHATGRWSLVASMCRAALAVGAHGLLVEVVESERARAGLRCDAVQGVTPAVLAEIVAMTRDSKVAGLDYGSGLGTVLA